MTVRAVDRALKIIQIVAGADDPVGLSEVSRIAGIDKATALRLLATLEEFHFVQRDNLTRRYSLGAGLWRLVHLWRHDLREVSESYLKSLLRATEETVQLVCPRGVERVVVQAFPAPHELCVVPAVGQAQPIYVGASGKVIMAFMEEQERNRIIELTGLRPLNPLGITDKRLFLEVLQETRRRGYATSRGDVTIGASAIAAPVFDATSKVVATVSLRAPDIRMSEERMAQIAPLVVETARSISFELGHNQDRSLSV